MNLPRAISRSYSFARRTWLFSDYEMVNVLLTIAASLMTAKFVDDPLHVMIWIVFLMQTLQQTKRPDRMTATLAA